MPAGGAAHRDSHELRDLAPVTVGEDAWVVQHGESADTPPGCNRHPRGCPRRIPSRDDANADFVDVETWKVRWLQLHGHCFLRNFMVDLFQSPHEQLERAHQLRS